LVGAASISAAACAHVPVLQRRPTPVPVVVTDVAYRSDPFLAELESRTFDYFWRTTDPQTGLTPDRSPTPLL
jgi:hypothetical protein